MNAFCNSRKLAALFFQITAAVFFRPVLSRHRQHDNTVPLGALIEAVRDQIRIVDLKHVNRVLIQPHWRKDYDNPLPSAALVA